MIERNSDTTRSTGATTAGSPRAPTAGESNLDSRGGDPRIDDTRTQCRAVGTIACGATIEEWAVHRIAGADSVASRVRSTAAVSRFSWRDSKGDLHHGDI